MKLYRTTAAQLRDAMGELIRISPRMAKAIGWTRYPSTIGELVKKLADDMDQAKTNKEACHLSSETAPQEKLIYRTPISAIEILWTANGWVVDVSGDEPGLRERALAEGWEEVDENK